MVVLSDASAAWTRHQAERLERAHHQFLRFADRMNLRPLPPDRVYQVWLVKDGRRYNGGYFTVDSSGYGQTLIFPYASIAEFEGIGITIEPIGGSSGPTGISVLKGDL